MHGLKQQVGRIQSEGANFARRHGGIQYFLGRTRGERSAPLVISRVQFEIHSGDDVFVVPGNRDLNVKF